MYTIYLYPSTSSKFSWHSSRQTATGAPHWGQANVAWDVLRLRESLGAGAQALKDERWVVFFFGVGKNNHSQLPKEKGKGDTFYWNYVTRVRTVVFFLVGFGGREGLINEARWKVAPTNTFPQIAIAIGVLTSNRGGGRRTTLADWTWHQGAIAGCRGRGAIAGCWGAIVVCYGWGAGLGEWTWCHCRVPL